MDLKEKIRTRTAKVGVIGLGYVGLPLAVEFAGAGFDVTGFDVEASRKIASFGIAFLDSRSIRPWDSKCATRPRRATSVTAPEICPASM